MKQLHELQLKILKNLLFARDLKYTELKPSKEIENNQFDFHLDKLIELGFITKTEDKRYSLTQKGKEYANTIDTDKIQVQKQAKIGAIVIGIKNLETEPEYLVYTRLKQPFYGCQGLMSGKVAYGEKVVETAKRELKEEANLDGDPEIVSITHFRVFDEDTKELIEDKFFYYCRVVDPKGEIVSNEEGKFEWVRESEVEKYLTNPFGTIERFHQEVNLAKSFNGNVHVEEIDHYTKKF